MNNSHTVLSIDLDTLPGCWMGTRFRKRRLVFDSHEYFPEVPEIQHRPFVKKIWMMLERFLVPKIDAGYTVCESIKNIYASKYGLSFEVIRNLPSRKKIANVEKAITDERFKVMYQGAINVGRGIMETLDAIRRIDEVLFVIAGSGDEINAVHDAIHEWSLEDKTRMLGKIPFGELASYTASADVGIVLFNNVGLNHYYALPNRLFDFIQAGVPVIAIDFPEIARVVSDYDCGLLIPDMEPNTIISAIQRLMVDKELHQKLSRNALKASSELVWEREEAILQTIYHITQKSV